MMREARLSRSDDVASGLTDSLRLGAQPAFATKEEDVEKVRGTVDVVRIAVEGTFEEEDEED